MGYFFDFFRVISERQISEDGMGDQVVTEHIVSPRGKRRISELKAAAAEQFNQHCKHDWDCCGQFYSSLGSVSRLSGNKFRIVLSHNRNV